MKLTKWALLGVAGLALVFLPKRSSPKPKVNHNQSNSPLTQDTNTPTLEETAIDTTKTAVNDTATDEQNKTAN